METAILCYIISGLVFTLMLASKDRLDPTPFALAAMLAIMTVIFWPVVVSGYIVYKVVQK